MRRVTIAILVLLWTSSANAREPSPVDVFAGCRPERAEKKAVVVKLRDDSTAADVASLMMGLSCRPVYIDESARPRLGRPAVLNTVEPVTYNKAFERSPVSWPALGST